jgi:dolichol-phosphate mannosyltransferase
MKKITIITPVFNEEGNIGYFYERCRKVADSLAGRYAVEFLFVNNCSRDRTLELILALHERDKRVRVITHSRNFGYQASAVSGMTHATGDALVIIDADCEDPPEMITDFVRYWEEGYDIVYGLRASRPEFFLLVWARKVFYRLTRLIADWDFVLDMAEFSLFSDRVRREVLRNRSTFPFVRSDFAYVGFRRRGIPYRREARAFGKTHYSILRMTQFALGGILTTSTFPLRLVVYVALPLTLLDLGAAVVSALPPAVLGNVLLNANLVFFVGAVATIAVYLSRVYKDSARRPIFIVDVQNSILPDPAQANENGSVL